MNKGLKANTYQETYQVGNAATISINVNSDDSNAIIKIPLLETIGINNMSLSLYYNYQNRDVLDIFGKGFKLNYYGKIIEQGTNYNVENFDGSIDKYIYKSSGINYEIYEDKKTQKTLKVKFDVQFINITQYEITDKYGNIVKYNPSELRYPTQTNAKIGVTYSYSFTYQTKTINNNSGDIIYLSTSNSLVSQLNYYHNSNLLITIDFYYDSNNRLTLVEYHRNSFCRRTLIIYDTNKLDIEAGEDLEYASISFSNNKVYSLTRGILDHYDQYSRKTMYFTYYAKRTQVSCGQYQTNYFFDEQNNPLYHVNSDGRVIRTNYGENEKLNNINAPIYAFNVNDNYLDDDWYVDIEDDDNVYITQVQCTDSFFNTFLDYVYDVGTQDDGYFKIEIPRIGIANDSITLAMWCKQLTPYSTNNYVRISLDTMGYDNDKIILKKTVLDGNYEFITLSLKTKISYSYIRIKVELIGNVSLLIGNMQLILKEYGDFYDYDVNSNVIESKKYNEKTTSIYNNDNLRSQLITSDSTMFTFVYDNHSRLIETQSFYGTKIENEYDSHNNVTKNRLTDEDETKYIETNYTYSSDGTKLLQIEDELGYTTSYFYDSEDRLIKTLKYDLTAIEKSFNNSNLIQTITIKDNNNSQVHINYAYDTFYRLSTITLDNNSLYSYGYDTDNNMNSISYCGNVVEKFTYNVDREITSQRYGNNSDGYNFTYNQHLLSSIYYVNSNNQQTLKHQFTYNNKKLTSQIKDENNNVTNSYYYDIDNQLIKYEEIVDETCSIDYEYDNLQNIILEKRILSGNSNRIINSYDTINRSRGSSPEIMINTYKTNQLLCYFMDETNVKNKTYNFGMINHSGVAVNYEILKERNIHYITLNINKPISYNLQLNNTYIFPQGNVSFWFKTTALFNKKYLFSTKSSDAYSFIGIYLYNRKLYLELIDIQGNTHDSVIVTDDKVKYNEWNYFGFIYYNRNDGIGYDDVCEYAICLNGQTKVFKQSNPRLRVDIDINPIFNIGHKYDGSNVSYVCSNVKLTCLIVNAGRNILIEELERIYRMQKDYIIDNTSIEDDSMITDYSLTSNYNISPSMYNAFDIFPLNNSIKSLTGTRPFQYSQRTTCEGDRDRSFNFNRVSNRYAYVADGSILVYKLNQSSSKTVLMRFYIDTNRTKQVLFDALDYNNHKLTVYIDDTRYIKMNYNNTVYSTNLYVTNNVWHSFALSYKEENQTFSFIIYLDRTTYSDSIQTSTTFGVLRVSIGRLLIPETTVYNIGYNEEKYALFGQIEMLCFSNIYAMSLSILDSFSNQLVKDTRYKKYDNLGMLKSINQNDGASNILSHKFTYKTRTESLTYLSTLVSQEKNRCFRNNLYNKKLWI